MNSFYNAIDINLLTSISEGFPYVIPEGGRMRLPTISSNVGRHPLPGRRTRKTACSSPRETWTP